MNVETTGFYHKAEKIHLLTRIVGYGFLLAVTYHVIAHLVGWRFPYDTYLTHPTDRFTDLLNAIPARQEFGFSLSIFASVNLLYWALFSFVPAWAIWIMIACFGVFLLGLAKHFLWMSEVSWKKNVSNVLIFSLCGYPVQFAIERGNIECFLFIFVALFVLLFNQKKFTAASASLAFAIEMKLFPAIFVTTYIKERRFKELGWLVIFLVIIASSLLLAPDFQKTLEHMHWFLDFYTRDYIIGNAGLAYGHSIFAFLKTSFFLIAPSILNLDPGEWLRGHSSGVLRVYTAFTFVVYFSVAFKICMSKDMPYWRMISILVVLFCLLPNVSADYKLLHLYLPVLLFVNAPSTRHDRKLTWLFGLLLIPKGYFHFGHGVEGGCSTLVEPILLILILWTLLKDDDSYRGRDPSPKEILG